MHRLSFHATFYAKLQPISPPELAFYGNDWKKYLEHYKLYAQFATEHPESAQKLTLDTSRRSDNYVRELVKSSVEPTEQTPLPSVVRKRDHRQVEQSPGVDEAVGAREKSHSVTSDRRDSTCTTVNLPMPRVEPKLKRSPSQESVELAKKVPEPAKPKSTFLKRQKTKQPQSPEERANKLYSVYMDKNNGVLHDSSSAPSPADCYMYLGKYLSHEALGQMTREARLPKTFKALNNLADQCERLGRTNLTLAEITSTN
jgi:hypothetical protein